MKGVLIEPCWTGLLFIGILASQGQWNVSQLAQLLAPTLSSRAGVEDDKVWTSNRLLAQGMVDASFSLRMLSIFLRIDSSNLLLC